jgi:hypothetical protein
MQVHLLKGSRNTFTLFGMCDDNLGSAFDSTGLLQRRKKLAEIVPIGLDYLPSECTPFVSQRLDSHLVLDFAGSLSFVAINDGGKVVDVKVGGRHRRLPYLSFVAFSVSNNAVDPEKGLGCAPYMPGFA